MLNLTFDDGPDERWTPRILGELERCQTRATFFMVGERVRARPDVARQVLDAGHEVQLHCHRHIRHNQLSEREIQRDAELGLAALAGVGARATLWRTPWGVRTDASARAAERLGLRLLGWSIDTHDWRGDEAQAMLAHARGQLADGGAVLMHDALGPGARRSGCENTISLLSALAATARELGLRLAPMGELAAAVPA